jgi:MoxR-like ATPase
MEQPPGVDANGQQTARRQVATFADLFRSIVDNVGKIIQGKTEVIELVVLCLVSEGHLLIEDRPGVGKTTMAKALAISVDTTFGRIQFTPDLLPSDVVGVTVFDRGANEFTFRAGPVFSNIVLADEINRASPKTQSALLEAMAEVQVTIDGHTHQLNRPFIVIATQNPIEHEGTYPLPDAQLDRFLLNVRIGYPAEEEEVRLTRQVTQSMVGDKLNVDAVQPVLEPTQVVTLQRLAAMLTVDDKVIDYAVRLARATRDHAGLTRGAGPRASIALIRAARASALAQGRAFASPDDVKRVALPVLRHRVSVSPEYEIEGRDADSILGDLMQQVEAPRL